jgi:hypothetical protein
MPRVSASFYGNRPLHQSYGRLLIRRTHLRPKALRCWIYILPSRASTLHQALIRITCNTTRYDARSFSTITSHSSLYHAFTSLPLSLLHQLRHCAMAAGSIWRFHSFRGRLPNHHEEEGRVRKGVQRGRFVLLSLVLLCIAFCIAYRINYHMLQLLYYQIISIRIPGKSLRGRNVVMNKLLDTLLTGKADFDAPGCPVQFVSRDLRGDYALVQKDLENAGATLQFLSYSLSYSNSISAPSHTLTLTPRHHLCKHRLLHRRIAPHAHFDRVRHGLHGLCARQRTAAALLNTLQRCEGRE